MRLLTCIVLTVWFSATAVSQIGAPLTVYEPDPAETDTLDGPHRSRLSFERLLSSYQWNLTHRTYIRTDRWFLLFDERFKSTLIRTDRNFLKDQQEMRIQGGRNITEKLDVRINASSLFLSDNQITGLNDAAINSAHGGFGYSLYPGLVFSPHIGYMSDRQSDRTDKGISYLARLQGTDLEPMEALHMHIDAQYFLNKIDPRETSQHFLYVSGDREFEGQTYAGFRSYYTSSRREFYFPADQPTQNIFAALMNIDRRLDRRTGFSGELQYELNPSLIGRFSTHLDSRTVTRDYAYKQTSIPSLYLFNTAVDEFTINLQVSMRYYLGNTFNGFTYMTYAERSEEHSVGSTPQVIPQVFYERRVESEFIKNNITRRTMLGTFGNIRMHRNHRISFSGSASIFRYDTPSPQNYDDRDELRIFGNIVSRHDLNRYVTLQLNMDLMFNHIVYLRSQRSANNNKNRVLRFSPSVTYSPVDWITSTNAFEVLANYTVYDFEDRLLASRSLSYRQMGWLDSTRVHLSESISLSMFSHYRRFERGELRWADFSERPVTSFEELTVIVGIRYELNGGDVAFTGGIRYFRQDRYRFERSDRIFETRFSNSGPVCMIYWKFGRTYLLTINGWYERQFRDGDHVSSIPNISVDIHARF